MAPLITLLLTYTIARIALPKRFDRTLPGRLALSAMLVLTGVAHFVATEAMVAMVPPVFPAPTVLVYLTGVAELAGALLLLAYPRRALGWVLVVFFAALLPANIYSAVERVGLGEHGPAYLWFRIPLQLLFMGWAVFFTRGGTGPWWNQALTPGSDRATIEKGDGNRRLSWKDSLRLADMAGGAGRCRHDEDSAGPSGSGVPPAR